MYCKPRKFQMLDSRCIAHAPFVVRKCDEVEKWRGEGEGECEEVEEWRGEGEGEGKCDGVEWREEGEREGGV